MLDAFGGQKWDYYPTLMCHMQETSSLVCGYGNCVCFLKNKLNRFIKKAKNDQEQTF